MPHAPGGAGRAGIDEDGIARVRDPRPAQRRRMENHEAVPTRPRRLRRRREQPVAVAVPHQGRIGKGDAVEQHAIEGPAQRVGVRPVQLHAARGAGFGDHVGVARLREDEGVGQVVGPLQHHRRPGEAVLLQRSGGDDALPAAARVIFEEDVGAPALREGKGIGVVAPAVVAEDAERVATVRAAAPPRRHAPVLLPAQDATRRLGRDRAREETERRRQGEGDAARQRRHVRDAAARQGERRDQQGDEAIVDVVEGARERQRLAERGQRGRHRREPGGGGLRDGEHRGAAFEQAREQAVLARRAVEQRMKRAGAAFTAVEDQGGPDGVRRRRRQIGDDRLHRARCAAEQGLDAQHGRDAGAWPRRPALPQRHAHPRRDQHGREPRVPAPGRRRQLKDDARSDRHAGARTT